ncbi:peptidase M12 [Pedobacter yulinensis]|uniref:Peptidase M12 n=1 Tax=Pedobacter yulinensis TaxID=2126353 RepID=A0A2T3HS01_9SPHI|nr:M12 family metallopeptidase [Pedobacter yulinensis]PST85218.1 peptidase M12 [Pedobacter yulinensis]
MKANRILIPLYLAMVCIAACQKDEPALAEQENPELQDSSRVMTDGNPGEAGVVKSAYLNGELVTYTDYNGEIVLEGDMILRDSMLSPSPMTTQTTGFKDRQWKNKTVYYDIAEELPDKYRVRNAIAHWEKHTPLRFVKRSNQRDYVHFVRGSGCSADLGHQGGRQVVKLARNCNTSTTIHEIGHAIGLLHEHTRTDQAEFVKIKWGNIQEDKKHNFRKWSHWNYNGFNMGQRMDFQSVMMYHSWSFAIDPSKPTLTRLDGSTFNGGSKLSEKDIATVKKMYANE